MMQYPNRPSFFAMKFARLLAKTCIANQIGQDAAFLLTVIASTEDAKGYRGPVSFFNEPLMNMSGFRRLNTFIAARRRAVEGGWLHYEPGTNKVAGLYFVLIPEAHRDWDDSSSDDSSDRYGVSKTQPLPHVDTLTPVKNATPPAIDPASHSAIDPASHSANLSSRIPVPEPKPIPEGDKYIAAPPGAASPKPSLFDDDLKEEAKKKPTKEQKPRERCPLFDALVKITGSDPKLNGKMVGKVRKALLSAEPPYTAAEVIHFGQIAPIEMTWLEGRKPTINEVEKHIGRVRNPSSGYVPPKRGFESREEKMHRQIREALADSDESSANYDVDMSDAFGPAISNKQERLAIPSQIDELVKAI